jgi:hypothetical protein
MSLARLTALACALVLACPALFAGCGSDGSSNRQGQSGAGEPASETPAQTSPGNDSGRGQQPAAPQAK